MTSRGPGRASRTLEMEEKEQLRRQIRLLQGGSGQVGSGPGHASLSSPFLHSGPLPASPKGVAFRPRSRRLGPVGWGGRWGRAGSRGPGGASRLAWVTSSSGFDGGCERFRRCGWWRRGGRLVTGGREGAPPPPRAGTYSVPPGRSLAPRARQWQSPLGARCVFLPWTARFDAPSVRTVTLSVIFPAQTTQSSVSRLFHL